VLAQDVDESPLTKALKTGRASAPLSTLGERYNRIGEAIQRTTKSDGEITIDFIRKTKFVKQPNCGRLTLVVVQNSTHLVFEKMGVEFNICEDGLPPRKMCAVNKHLVNYDATCPGGVAPVDTPEVAAAIAKSLADGGLTKEQAMKFDQKPGAVK